MPRLLVIPSIDIKDGKTVRVVQGIPELNCKDYGSDPVEMAMIWRTENAKFIHVVDFDHSHFHLNKNYPIIKEICESVVIPVEFGGGISSFDEALEAMDLGVTRLVIGSLAYTNPNEFSKIIKEIGSSRISAGIDVISNKIAIRGRSEIIDLSPIEYARQLEDVGVNRVIVTDVSRNGMLKGANIELSKSIATNTNLKVTHSGGVTNRDELFELDSLVDIGVDSVILGRVLYENKLACQKIWRIAESGIFD
jgi:phosphoribosylformimino-5-aminoimidazole carboxamide ribotide isomerase